MLPLTLERTLPVKRNNSGSGGWQDPVQGSLFGEGPDRTPEPVKAQEPAGEYTPDPKYLRRVLLLVLKNARAAKTMPWTDYQARKWEVDFPRVAKYLPEEEAERLCADFWTEMARLKERT